jgi:hypothetical protein
MQRLTGIAEGDPTSTRYGLDLARQDDEPESSVSPPSASDDVQR